MFQFAWPITALASIAHRASGIVLFAGIGYLLWLLDLSLSSQSGFADAQEVMAEPIPKLILLGVLAMLLYHLIAGIKHLLMDFHIGDSFAAASANSIASFVITAVLTLGMGVWLW
jgi:succinate dehydrogenase / fumarate reductase cytochrome b subunit